MPAMYMISTIATPFILPKWMEVRVWLMTSAFFLGVSLLFVGPVTSDKSLVTMCFGLFFTGCLLGPLIIPNMQEMIDAAVEAHPKCDLEHASSMIGGMLNSAYGAGGVIGPLVGSILYQFAGFQQMSDIVGGLSILFAVAYFYSCNGWEAFQSTFKARESMSAVDALAILGAVALGAIVLLLSLT